MSPTAPRSAQPMYLIECCKSKLLFLYKIVSNITLNAEKQNTGK